MATSAGSHVIPLRKTTKARLTAAKGKASYDEVLGVLLSTLPASQLRVAMEYREERLRNIAAVRADLRSRPRVASRSPEKQILTARLAEKRWTKWIQDGRIVVRGPRLFDWYTQPETKEARIRVDWEPRRGLAASESP